MRCGAGLWSQKSGQRASRRGGRRRDRRPHGPPPPAAFFFRLKELKKDARIEVHREDGTTAVFTVDAIDTFKKDAFPTDKVYGGTHGRPELRLITCGGNLAKDRHWDSDVVVFAHLTGKA
ncbi:sortase [Streptomyces sp. A0592]|uniref:sortase domain-containing protein n=1 Tax=Streptomyces sp. A0592 TaxID=2563099 RepID=UPI001F10D60F|nr:sortase [Streptomyces sp. A0592]